MREAVYQEWTKYKNWQWYSGDGRTDAMIETATAAATEIARERKIDLSGYYHFRYYQSESFRRIKIKIKVLLTPLYVLITLFVPKFSVYEQGIINLI